MKKIARDVVGRVRIIELSSDGFMITSARPESKAYCWKDIDKIINQQKKVEVYINDRIAEILSDEDSNFYEFIQGIPEGFDGFDYQFFTDFLSKLKGCKCCGLIAIHENKCLACGFENWNNDYMDEFDSAEEYLREQQFDLFEPFEDEEVNINNLPEQGFKSDNTWIPMISEEDYKK